MKQFYYTTTGNIIMGWEGRKLCYEGVGGGDIGWEGDKTSRNTSLRLGFNISPVTKYYYYLSVFRILSATEFCPKRV